MDEDDPRETIENSSGRCSFIEVSGDTLVPQKLSGIGVELRLGAESDGFGFTLTRGACSCALCDGEQLSDLGELAMGQLRAICPDLEYKVFSD